MNNHQLFRRYWANKTINYCFRVFIILTSAVFCCWYLEQTSIITPITLGIFAAALSETDEKLIGRLKALLLTFVCFAIASFSIEILFNNPMVFALGLFSSTFGFIMLGSLGPRYSSIAFGSLLIAIYTMLGAHENHNYWYQPLLLLIGSSFYYVVSIIWQFFFPLQSVQQNLASVFTVMGTYLEQKSELFHPSINVAPSNYRLTESKNNTQVVTALNEAKNALLTKATRGHIVGSNNRYLKIYFIAQDIHERINSSHYRYQELATLFNRSDILFRFKHLLHLQSIASQKVAYSLSLNLAYQHSSQSILALDELQESLFALKQKNNNKWGKKLIQLEYLFHNLVSIEKSLNNICELTDKRTISSHTISDNKPQNDDILLDTMTHTPVSMWQTIKINLTKDSVLFRHAIRMSFALTIGYGIVQLFDLDKGYWILLTTLFVCQPNYSATKEKLIARIIGTFLGLFVGSLLLTLFPSTDSQLVLMIISGVLFFAFRLANYGFATAFITILVLLCFNQLGEGYAVILPRLLDTIIGCVLAVLAVSYVLPNWHYKQLYHAMFKTMDAHQQYLAQIIQQYHSGKKNALDYRIARRQAHDNEAILNTTINNMLIEPRKYQMAIEESFRFLYLSHMLLSYISALGAHRTHLTDIEEKKHIDHLYEITQLYFDAIKSEFNAKEINVNVNDKLKDQSQYQCSNNIFSQQFRLMHSVFPEILLLTKKLTSLETEKSNRINKLNKNNNK